MPSPPPLDGQTRKGRRGNETCWANRARISSFPLFEIACSCIRAARKREILFVVVGLVLFLPRFTQTRMSMQVAYDQTGPDAEVREHANSSLSANRSDSKGRKKRGKAGGLYWVIKVARYGALIKRPDKTPGILEPKTKRKTKN